MKQNDKTEQELQQLFAAARRQDEREASTFREVLRGGPIEGGRFARGAWFGRPIVWAMAAGLALTLTLPWVLPGDGGRPADPLAPVDRAALEKVMSAEPDDAGETRVPLPEPTPFSEPQPVEPSHLSVLDPTPEPKLAVVPPPTPPTPPVADVVSPKSLSVGAVRGLAIEVADANGPLPGSTVTVVGPTTNRAFQGLAIRTTDAGGKANVNGLQADGEYVVKVEFPGYPTEVSKVRMKADDENRVSVSLTPEVIERVTVVGQAPEVSVLRTTTATRFSDDFIEDLPVPGRFYQNVLTLAPGAQDARNEGDPGVHGSRDRDFIAIVSGVSNVDPNSIEELEFNTEAYDPIRETGFLTAKENPLSTFSIDVDTASYANVRRFLNGGALPPPNAVRIEEMINYFHYDYPAPTGKAPFSADVEVADCPWNPEHRLARIGLMGQQVSRAETAGSNLVFLLDVSGSMSPPNKLPLLKSAFSLLVEQLDGNDQVAIVVYAGASGLVLPSTPGSDHGEILGALDRLNAGGGTNGGEGLALAYKTARENFIPGGINRVILATDGDFNLGMTDRGQLLERLKKDAKKGIFLTALGFGMGNYKDATLETLADKGNGNYAYIDSLREARKVLVEEIGGTLVTIAKDVKIQVEFNPAQVGAYRLIGYENRMLKKEDFNDDTKDAGEIGSGHTVTALYELVPPGAEKAVANVEPLKYQSAPKASSAAESDELLTLKIRYKDPDADTSRLLEFPIVDEGRTLGTASVDFKFAAAVAQFGMVLRGSAHKGSADLERVRSLALDGMASDSRGYRAEFVDLVNRAAQLDPR